MSLWENVMGKDGRDEQLATFNHVLAAHTDAMKTLGNAVRSINDRLERDDTLREGNSGLCAENGRLHEQLVQLKASYDRDTTALRERIDLLEGPERDSVVMKDLREELEKWKTQCLEARDEVDELEDEIEDLQKKLEKRNRELRVPRFKGQPAMTASAALTTAQRKIGDLREEVAKWKKTAEEFQEDLREVAAEKDEFKEKGDKWQSLYYEVIHQREKIIQEREVLRSQIARADETVNEMRRVNNNLKRQLKQSDEDRELLIEKLRKYEGTDSEALHNRVSELTVQCDNLRVSLRNSEEERLALKDRLNAAADLLAGNVRVK